MNEYLKRKIKGKKYIGSGIYRDVYDLGNGFVFKIAKSKRGIKCNRTEVMLYNSPFKPIKKYLAKITDYDKKYRWVIMKKYIRGFPNTPKYRQDLMKVVNLFWGHGIMTSKKMRRVEKPNFPYLPLKHLRLKRNNQIVVIDYGGFLYNRK